MLDWRGLGPLHVGTSTMTEVLGSDEDVVLFEWESKGVHLQFDRGRELSGVALMGATFESHLGLRVGDRFPGVANVELGASVVLADENVLTGTGESTRPADVSNHFLYWLDEREHIAMIGVFWDRTKDE